jgi:hypothetical protein
MPSMARLVVDTSYLCFYMCMFDFILHIGRCGTQNVGWHHGRRRRRSGCNQQLRERQRQRLLVVLR